MFFEMGRYRFQEGRYLPVLYRSNSRFDGSWSGFPSVQGTVFLVWQAGDENNRNVSKAALSDPCLSYMITKAPLEVTAGSYTMTYGDELPAFAFSYDGFVSGEDSTALVPQPVSVARPGRIPMPGNMPSRFSVAMPTPTSLTSTWPGL